MSQIIQSPKRLFLGTVLSQKEQNKLKLLRQTNEAVVANWSVKPKWLAAEKLHLTWLFLGNLDQGQEESLVLDLNQFFETWSSSKNIVLEFNKADFFPSGKSPRTVALLPSTLSSDFEKLALNLRTLLQKHCQKPENKPFLPHITLLRLANTKNGLTLFSPLKISNVLPLILPIEEICLIQSHLGSDKNEYQIINKFSVAKNKPENEND